MKVTPAHDPVDYLIAKKHNLEIINVIDEDGKMTEHAGKFQVQCIANFIRYPEI